MDHHQFLRVSANYDQWHVRGRFLYMSGRYMEGFWKVSWRRLEGVVRLRQFILSIDPPPSPTGAWQTWVTILSLRVPWRGEADTWGPVEVAKGSHHKKNGKIWEKFPNRLDPATIGNFSLFWIFRHFWKLLTPPFGSNSDIFDFQTFLINPYSAGLSGSVWPLGRVPQMTNKMFQHG